MAHAPMLLGVLNAIAMKALSQGPWWIVKASDTSLIISSWYRKGFLMSQLLFILFWYSIDDYIHHKCISLYFKESYNSCFSALVWSFQHLVISEFTSIGCLFPWDPVTFSWLLLMLLNFGLYPGYCEWYLLESVILLLRIWMLLSWQTVNWSENESWVTGLWKTVVQISVLLHEP